MSTQEDPTNAPVQCSEEQPPAPKFLNQIRQHIKSAKNPSRLTFRDVDPAEGSLIAKELDQEVCREEQTCGYRINRIHPSQGLDLTPYRVTYNSLERILEVGALKGAVHFFHKWWLSEQLVYMGLQSIVVTEEELELLGLGNGSAFTGFTHPYTSSVRAPDECIMQRNKDMPNIVIESRWGGTPESIIQDVSMWLKGGAGIVQLVILFVWASGSNGKVDADIKVYGLDKDGNVALLQTETLFPAPIKGDSVESGASNEVHASQSIRVTRWQLFGSSLPAGRNPEDVFAFSLNHIRSIALEALGYEGRTVS